MSKPAWGRFSFPLSEDRGLRGLTLLDKRPYGLGAREAFVLSLLVILSVCPTIANCWDSSLVWRNWQELSSWVQEHWRQIACYSGDFYVMEWWHDWYNGVEVTGFVLAFPTAMPMIYDILKIVYSSAGARISDSDLYEYGVGKMILGVIFWQRWWSWRG